MNSSVSSERPVMQLESQLLSLPPGGLLRRFPASLSLNDLIYQEGLSDLTCEMTLRRQ